MAPFKKHLNLIVFGLIFLPSISNAQFPNKDGRWFFSTFNPGGERFWDPIIVEKDTTIGEYEYSIMSSFYYGMRIAYRSDSLKVYTVMLNGDFNSEFLMYDFGLNKGDTIQLLQASDPFIRDFDTIYYQVREAKKIEINNNLVNYLFLENNKCCRFMEWVEGIGSLSTPFYPVLFEFFENSYRLECYKEGLTLIYGYCLYSGQKELYSIQNFCFYHIYSKELIFINENIYNVKIIDTNGKLIFAVNSFCDKKLNLSFLKKGNYIGLLEYDDFKTNYKFSVY